MNAASPTAGAFLTVEKFRHGSIDASQTRFCLFGVFNPTNKLVSRNWRETFTDACELFSFY
jgi:hypothetical protein